MKKFLPLASIAAMFLAACSGQNAANLTDASDMTRSGFTGIRTLTSCAIVSGDCFPLEVESDGAGITRIHYPTDTWVATPSSGCNATYCWATDANNAQWRIEL